MLNDKCSMIIEEWENLRRETTNGKWLMDYGKVFSWQSSVSKKRKD
jgi:hypothetical protein